ncbi:MAG: hypothetical protein VW551_08330 [Euryarchaeota archaeon]|jgi:hypothetical protein
MDEGQILEHLILDDMQQWVEHRLLNGQDMYDYLDTVEQDLGKDAKSEELQRLMDTYYSDHILKV